MFGLFEKSAKAIGDLAAIFGWDPTGSLNKRKQCEAYLKVLLDYIGEFYDAASKPEQIDPASYAGLCVFINSGQRMLPKDLAKLLRKTIGAVNSARSMEERKAPLEELRLLSHVLISSYHYVCTTTGTPVQPMTDGGERPRLPPPRTPPPALPKPTSDPGMM